MPRQDVPYGGAICRLKERIAEIWDKLGEKLHTINGVEGDAAGNVKIVSGDPAVVITNNAASHEIEIGLDSLELPSAAVASVNGRTGAVVLDASDIQTDSGNVQSDLDDLSDEDDDLRADIQSETLARQNADSALQTNINAALATIPGEVSSQIAADATIQQLVAADAQNVKLTGNQNINGIKSVPLENTGTYSGQIASSQKVKNELDNYAPMARLANNQTFLGVNAFDALIANGLWNNKSTVCTSANNDTTVFKRLYTSDNSSGSQYSTIVLLVTTKRGQVGRFGILMISNNRNATFTAKWMIKPDDIATGDFVATREGNVNTIWCRSFGTGSDGYHAIKLAEHGTSDEAGNRWTKIVNDAGKVITQNGYVDSGGVTHTFDRYVEAN